MYTHILVKIGGLAQTSTVIFCADLVRIDITNKIISVVLRLLSLSDILFEVNELVYTI